MISPTRTLSAYREPETEERVHEECRILIEPVREGYKTRPSTSGREVTSVPQVQSAGSGIDSNDEDFIAT